MEGICQQDFKSRTQAIAPEGGLILTKLTKRRTRFFFTGEFVSVATIPGPTALVGQTSLRLEDAYVYELEALAETLANFLNKHGIGGEPWRVSTVSHFVDIPFFG